jgi:hypothetical protein
MSLTERILSELENGPGTYAEICAAINAEKPKSVCGILANLASAGKIKIVGKLEHRASVKRGRRENVYGLLDAPEIQPQQAPMPDSGVIADNQYAIATRRTYANIIFPGAGSRRGL